MGSAITRRDMAGLVRRRARIQEMLLTLWRFGDGQIHALAHPESTLFHLALGAAFSLWRAAFLIQDKRTKTTMNKHAMMFLSALCWDNAISYGSDRTARAWTVGYYLNNAHLRLQAAAKHLPSSHSATPPFTAVNTFLSDQNKRGIAVPNRRRGWDAAMDAMDAVVKYLTDRHPEQPATKRGKPR